MWSDGVSVSEGREIRFYACKRRGYEVLDKEKPTMISRGSWVKCS